MYSEHVGSNRQAEGSQGETRRLYARRRNRMRPFIGIHGRSGIPARGALDEAGRRAHELAAQRAVGRAHAFAPGVDDEIEVIRDLGVRFSEYLAEEPLRTIARHCAPDFARHRDAEAVMPDGIWPPEKNEALRVELLAVLVKDPVVRAAHDSVRARETLSAQLNHLR